MSSIGSYSSQLHGRDGLKAANRRVEIQQFSNWHSPTNKHASDPYIWTTSEAQIRILPKVSTLSAPNSILGTNLHTFVPYPVNTEHNRSPAYETRYSINYVVKSSIFNRNQNAAYLTDIRNDVKIPRTYYNGLFQMPRTYLQ